LPQCDTNEVIVQIRAQKAAVDRDVPGGGSLEREEDPTADPRVGELDSKGWVVVVAGRQHRACRRRVVGAERLDP
jgi:hypothetical protein